MSQKTVCDICLRYNGTWEFRNRKTLFQWHGCGDYVWKEELDMCDKCLTDFQQFVKSRRDNTP